MSAEDRKPTPKSGGNTELIQDPNHAVETNSAAVYEKRGNQYDEMDMDRMGKLQELRVGDTGRKEPTSYIGILTSYVHRDSGTFNSCLFLATP